MATPKHIWKLADTKLIDLEIIECGCGFHLGIDGTYLEQVGDVIIECPACQTKLNTRMIIS